MTSGPQRLLHLLSPKGFCPHSQTVQGLGAMKQSYDGSFLTAALTSHSLSNVSTSPLRGRYFVAATVSMPIQQFRIVTTCPTTFQLSKENSQMTKRSVVYYVATAMAITGSAATLVLRAAADEVYNPSSSSARYNHVRIPDAGHAIRVVINRQQVDFNGPGPIMVDGSHVFVPIRGVFEQMGGLVTWHPDHQSVHGTSPGHEFRLTVGSPEAWVNGVQQTMPSAPMLMDGTTYVPLRFASEALGARVHWHEDTNTVTIHTGAGPDDDTQ